jgi:hypothetical protein
VSSAAKQPARGSLSIGDVLEQLKVDFPKVTISKIRFLEDEGLVRPDRTPSGYRKFAASDVARLRYVLSQQRDHYLPLRVIKEQLDAIDRGPGGLRPNGAVRNTHLELEPMVGAPESFAVDPTTLRLSVDELLNAAGLRPEQLRELEHFKLITKHADGHYDEDALSIAKAVAELAPFGIEARHLRGFKSAADREVGLFAQITAPMLKQRGGDGRSRAEEAVRELASVSVRLHTALVQVGLRGVVG